MKDGSITSSSEIFRLGGWLAVANRCGGRDGTNTVGGQRLEHGRELSLC